MKKPIFTLIASVLIVANLQAQIDSIRFPVSLSSFEAGLTNNTTRLKWKTVCYISYANFQIQKSENGTTFTTINSFVADRLRCQQPFQFIDSTGNSHAEIVYYRINAGDIDGHFYNSKIIKVSHKQTDFEIVSVYPTVINSNATVVLSSPYDGNIKLKLVNPNGSLVKEYNYNLKKGVSNYSLDFANVSKGVYWLKLADTKGIRQSIAIIKQ